jgi:transcriptional regulator GlxA family with amidase domain
MPRRVVLVAYPGVQALDLTGPADAFAIASAVVPDAYEVELVAHRPAPLRAANGLRLVPDRALQACRGPIDTLLVAGGPGVIYALDDGVLVEWIATAAGRARRVASVCTGAFLLARAGLLDGRRATTHWAGCAELERRHPEVRVERDPIYVRDGRIYTSAGITAGIDLAIAMIEEDLGPRVALDVARMLVLFVKRPGGQAQFSAQLAAQAADREPLRELQAWLPDHLDEDLSVPALAARVFMSPRNFARAFRREVGMTPAAYVEALRVERARMLLETTDLPVEEVARRCGFGSVETLRRAFARRLNVTPSAYRDRFRPVLGTSRVDESGDAAATDAVIH